MIRIEVSGGKIENALKKYKYLHRKCNIKKNVRDNGEFIKSSVKRRKEIDKAKYRQRITNKENR